MRKEMEGGGETMIALSGKISALGPRAAMFPGTVVPEKWCVREIL